MRMRPFGHLGVPSTAAVAGHPIHPMLVVFPISFLVAVLASDLAFWGTNDPFWARASNWLLGAGVVMGSLTVRLRPGGRRPGRAAGPGGRAVCSG